MSRTVNDSGVPRHVRDVARAIDAELPELARRVIRRHLDLHLPDTIDFLRQPDARGQHQTRWHQWGIISHTREFVRHFETDIPRYLREWDLWNSVDEILRQPVDGIPRWELLRISILLHDIGKFGARTRGKKRFHFTNHERLSGDIIRREINLCRFGLSPIHAEYIARTAEDHFVLGLVRKRARDNGSYDEAFTHSEEFARICDSIKDQHADDFVEIGVLFLGDSLAKADPAGNPQLAASLYQANVIVAQRYLETVLRPPPYNVEGNSGD